MAYKVAFVSEHGYNGKIPDTETNLRTDITIMKALDATQLHWNTPNLLDELSNYDVALIIIPKTNPVMMQYIPQMKNHTKIILFQEGPSDWYMKWSMQWQYWYLKCLNYFDAIFCHNKLDKYTFEGLLMDYVPVYICPSIIDLKKVNEIKNNKQEEKIMLGGNCFLPGQKVLMSNKKFKNIEDIQIPNNHIKSLSKLTFLFPILI